MYRFDRRLVPHLTTLFSEVFGVPTRYTDELGGFSGLLAPHRGLQIREDQRQRYVDLFLAAADAVDWPADARTRDALHGYLEFVATVAAQNSHATTEGELHPCQEFPRWNW